MGIKTIPFCDCGKSPYAEPKACEVSQLKIAQRTEEFLPPGTSTSETSCSSKQECELSTELCNTLLRGHRRMNQCKAAEMLQCHILACCLLRPSRHQCPLNLSAQYGVSQAVVRAAEVCPCSGCQDLPVLVCVCASKSQSSASSCALNEGVKVLEAILAKEFRYRCTTQ